MTRPDPADVRAMRLGNVARTDGVDRCYCGCKYWRNDRCVDCGCAEPMVDDDDLDDHVHTGDGDRCDICGGSFVPFV